MGARGPGARPRKRVLTPPGDLTKPTRKRSPPWKRKGLTKAQQVIAFLESLPKDSRVIFLRRYWYVDTIAEIARQYGMTESKVKMQLSRTKEKLRIYLEKEEIRV